MAKLKFDQVGERLYETGVKDCVLYVYDKATGKYKPGVAWNGVTAITESPSGAEPTALYADDSKYLTLVSAEEFGATVEAYTYPDEFAECNGEKQLVDGMYFGQQTRTQFALVYKTTVGNDEAGNEYGYKLHVIYGCLAAPSEKAYATINDSPEAITFSWEISTTPVPVTINGVTYKPTSVVTVDSTKFMTEGVLDSKFTDLVDKLYGTDGNGEGTGTEPTLAMPDEIHTMLKAS